MALKESRDRNAFNARRAAAVRRPRFCMPLRFEKKA